MKIPASVKKLATALFIVFFNGAGIASSASVATGDHALEDSPRTEKSANGDQPQNEAASNPSATSTKKSSSWIDLSPGFIGIAAQDPEIATSFRKKSSTSSVRGDVTVDGIVVNVEADFAQYRSEVVAALEEGMLVVLDSSGSEEAQTRIQELSLELAHLGVKAAAVMLYKGGPNDGVGLFAFAANEKTELAALMKKVGRRDSVTQESK